MSRADHADTQGDKQGDRQSNLRMLGKLVVVAAAMFGFGYAMIPIYKAICEVTGVGLLTPRDAQAEEFAKNTQVDPSRSIVVEFDANSRGAWLFKPEKRSVTVHPGELVTVNYELVNTQPRETIGQAIPSYAPQQSAAYFRKIECFCFKQQALGANEVKRFPVVFVVDPKLPKDVNTITLSYTFFEVGGQVGGQVGTGPRGQPGA
jgi:cytochrome c oxidase assembly protein subunit 11